MSEATTATNLPQYQCHKRVQAIKIHEPELRSDGSALLTPVDADLAGIGKLLTCAGWAERFKGTRDDNGYYVMYEDGYESWSPSEAFEGGYTRIDETVEMHPSYGTPAGYQGRGVTTPREIPYQLTSHQVNACNEQLRIEVADEKGAGGAHHLYDVTGFDTATNPSDPYQQRYGVSAKHSAILFQNGPIPDAGVNGVTNEALLAILEHRLACFQAGDYACPENARALIHVREAMRSLHRRTLARVARGVEGTHQV